MTKHIMTLDHHRQRIRQILLRLQIADYGMGMPRDYATVLMLTAELANARKDLAAAEHDAQKDAERASAPLR